MTGDSGTQQARTDSIESPVRALAIISNELNETLRNAHLALEDCVDGRGGSAALVRAGELLHQVRGALQMTETYGAALLAEEMELCCQYLGALAPGKGRDDGLDALTRSMVQLPVYIERLLGGGRDIALVLLPLLNDLRAARGQPLLSEGTLLLLNLSPTQSADKAARREGSGEAPVTVATRLRPKFQLALLGWIKGGDTSAHLKTLSQVAAALESASTRDDMYQLWWVVGGVLEALQDGGLETSVSLKRLLGQTDRQMKYLIDEGVQAFDRHPVDDLLNNLLYYVARATNAGDRISEIRAAFNLSELLPGDEQVEHARDALSAPSVKLMKTVASAIKEDLGRVKDVLDIFVRTGMNKPSELVPQLELLKKISDTLGVLGLGELRSDIDAEIDRLKGVVERGGVANDQIILDIASTLLRVEDRLDQQLLRLTVPQDAPQSAAAGLPAEEAADYQQVAESVMRECIINLARIKETISQSMTSDAPSQGLDSIPALVQGIKAGLMMLNKTRAMEVVDRVGRIITVILQSGGPSQLSQKETDRLADAIVSIEYYMETVKAGRSEPWYMLDNAEACLAVLQEVEKRIAEQDEEPAETTQRIPRAEIEAAALEVPPDTGRHQATEVMPLPVFANDSANLDPELLELFIEEAKEEIASIKRNLPPWAESPDDMETLITVRRSFHTLKGSGRMVGAERIGEYCWSIENLLNRLINHTLVRTPPMVDFVLEAAAAVPGLVEQLEVGTEPAADINLLIARAHAFAEGDPNAAVLTIDLPDSAPLSEEPALEMDPVLLDIFAKETAGHLQVIRDYLAACEGHSPPFDVTDKLHRACHTLHGSANMANVERGVAVAGALNRFVRRVHEWKTGFEKSGLDALLAAAKAIATIVADINRPDRERADYSKLIEHLTRLTDSLERPETTLVGIDPADSAIVTKLPAEAARPVEVDEPLEAQADEPEEAEYDAEIAAIFTEESAELLEATDKAFSEWTDNRSNAGAMEELKRHLHTLKGGARMAGITAMGNLSHEIETLLISIGDNRVESSPEVQDLLQHSIDELHRMRDTVIAGKPVRSSADIEARIRQANEGFAFADEMNVQDEPGEVEETEATAFTIEPDDSVSMIIVDSPLADELDQMAAATADDVVSADSSEPVAESETELELDLEQLLDAEPEPTAGPESEPESEPEPELEAEPE
ncbi:MAG: Hpt domain-containing protein, partial [Gammaproteobacteria bacterium]|nr:Hpt domain-containing protein [Gammaproteobacteria bacterium]